MAGEGTFDVDPQEVTAGTSLLSELSEEVLSVSREFDSAMADIGWTGTDKNGLQIRGNFVTNRDSAGESLRQIAEVVELAVQAVLDNLKGAQNTQTGNIDSISAAETQYDDLGRRG